MTVLMVKHNIQYRKWYCYGSGRFYEPKNRSEMGLPCSWFVYIETKKRISKKGAVKKEWKRKGGNPYSPVRWQRRWCATWDLRPWHGQNRKKMPVLLCWQISHLMMRMMHWQEVMQRHPEITHWQTAMMAEKPYIWTAVLLSIWR